MGLGIVVLVCIPFLISGPAWGIGITQFWNQSDPRGAVYDRPAIAYLACVGKYLFIGWLGFTFALRGIRREYCDVARVFGLSRLRQYWTVVVPLTLPYALVMGAIIFLLVLGEVDSLLLVSPPGFTIIPVRVYGLMHYGPSPLVSAMAILMVLVVGLTLGLLAVVTAWMTRGHYESDAT
jgi:ABC-type Fe3+ transport system permease subunit